MPKTNVLFHYIPQNNHGCSGARVLVEIDHPRSFCGRVVESSNCSSCQATGCDGRTSLNEGDFVELRSDLSWEEATEFIEDGNGDISFSGQTRVPEPSFVAIHK